MKKIIILAILVHFTCLINAQVVWINETKLKGKVGAYDIVMTLAVPFGGANTCFVIGEYYYLSKRKNIDLCSSDDEKIIESVNGQETGYFVLKNWNVSVGQKVVGTWYSMDGEKKYPVTLKVFWKGKD